MEQTKKFVTLTEVTAILGTDNDFATERFAKSRDCLERIGPIKRVDIKKSTAIVDDEIAKKAATKSDRMRVPGLAQELGLINARLELYEGRRKTKLVKIDEAKELVSSAKN